MTSRYGKIFEIDDLSAGATARKLDRVELKAKKSDAGYNEAWLQRLLADHPQALPITEIEPFLEKAVPICLELNTKAGPIDLLLVSPRGDIVVVECKLWRNPQARREVVGQILDYAKELPHLSYEGFEAEIFKAQPANGAQKADPLYVRTGAEAEGLTEHEFIDAVSRNLRRGRFLLLIVGDGIQEGVEAIADFLQQHAGMHFTLALVEMAIFKREPEGYIVQPRILARTQMVPRGVVAIQDNQIVVHPGAGTTPTSIIGANGKPASFAAAMPATISETRLYEQLDAHTPPLANRLRAFVNMLDEVGVNQRFTATMIVLEGVARETSVYLAHVDVKYANIWFGDVIKQAASLGRKDAALRYYLDLASLLKDPALREQKLHPTTKTGAASLPLVDLLDHPEEWLAAAKAYISSLEGGDVGQA